MTQKGIRLRSFVPCSVGDSPVQAIFLMTDEWQENIEYAGAAIAVLFNLFPLRENPTCPDLKADTRLVIFSLK